MDGLLTDGLLMDGLLPTACALCPRACGANRAAGEKGACGADDRLYVARAALHYWEEPPISGTHGSGAVFFSHCSLRCVYCQNASISMGDVGKETNIERLGRIFCELEAQGAHNINLVTPTHYAPQIRAALDEARAAGMALPVVYNTSGYETVCAIRALEGYVDVYLTDLKYASPALAARYSNAPDYPKTAWAALDAMVEQVGAYEEGDSSLLARRGVIVRHLALPGQVEDSKAVLGTLFSRYQNRICYSLMSQFTPIAGQLEGFAELRRTLSGTEYDELVDYALALGIETCFTQEAEAASEDFIPPFDLDGV
jgi:putative pyruvate formate lyase activating enzyme